MRKLLRGLAVFCGFLINLLGLVGLSEVAESWPSWLAVVHDFLSNPVAYFTLTLGGTLIMALALGDWFADQRIAKAGGLTGREFRENLENWSTVKSFYLRDVVWLWNGLKPNSGEYEFTVTNPTLRRLEQALNEGALKLEAPHGNWSAVLFTRQNLVDLAYAVGERPKFLFPRRYRSMWVAPDHDEYMSIGMVSYGLVEYHRERGEELNMDTTRELLRKDGLRWGKWEAIGRERVDDVLYQHVWIPALAWWVGRWTFPGFTVWGRRYEDLKVRQKGK